jgi:hypothetical protein
LSLARGDQLWVRSAAELAHQVAALQLVLARVCRGRAAPPAGTRGLGCVQHGAHASDGLRLPPRSSPPRRELAVALRRGLAPAVGPHPAGAAAAVGVRQPGDDVAPSALADLDRADELAASPPGLGGRLVLGAEHPRSRLVERRAATHVMAVVVNRRHRDLIIRRPSARSGNAARDVSSPSLNWREVSRGLSAN